MKPRPIPANVLRWPEEHQMLWLERAGYQLDAGASPAVADATATLQMVQWRAQRKEAA